MSRQIGVSMVPRVRRAAAALGVVLGALLGASAATSRTHDPVLQLAQPHVGAIPTVSAGSSVVPPAAPVLVGALSSSPAPAVPVLPAPLELADVPADPRISALAADGIPAVALHAYRSAAEHAPPSCHLSWTLLAGIGRVESDHGRFGGARLYADGMSLPHIIGIALDGSASARILDTDRGLLDGDRVYDHAVGPMQFIPSTWAGWGVDADGDGVANPFDINDAAAAAANYLCAAGGDLSTVEGRVRAVLAYNHSTSYVADVLALAAAYGGEGGVVALPLPPVPPIAPVDPAQPPALPPPALPPPAPPAGSSPAAPSVPPTTVAATTVAATSPPTSGTATGTATTTATLHPSMTQTPAPTSSTATSAGATSSAATSAGATSSAAPSATGSDSASASASASSCPDLAPSTSSSVDASSSAGSTAPSTVASSATVSAVDSSSGSSGTGSGAGSATSTTTSPDPCAPTSPAPENVPVSSGIPALGAAVLLALGLLATLARRRHDGRGRHENGVG